MYYFSWEHLHPATIFSLSTISQRCLIIKTCCCCCSSVASVVSDSVRPHRGQPTRLHRPGILQARTLKWVAISFSNAWKWKVKGKSLSRVRPSATPWTAAFQAPPSMGFSRQEYWSGVPLPSRMEDYSAFKKKSCHLWQDGNLECIIRSHISQTEHTQSDPTYMWNLKKLNSQKQRVNY